VLILLHAVWLVLLDLWAGLPCITRHIMETKFYLQLYYLQLSKGYCLLLECHHVKTSEEAVMALVSELELIKLALTLTRMSFG